MSDLDNILTVFWRRGRTAQFMAMMAIGAAIGIILAFSLNMIGRSQAAHSTIIDRPARPSSEGIHFSATPPTPPDFAAALGVNTADEKAINETALQPHCSKIIPHITDLGATGAPIKCGRHGRLPLDDSARFSPSPEVESMSVPIRPRIAIIIDDMTSSQTQIRRVSALPSPLTLSFLPYARALSPEIAHVTAQGHGVMLHLPMEAIGASGDDRLDPGPDALYVHHDAREIEARLIRNLDKFEGYAGVNNHMGSRFTAQYDQMTAVMKVLKSRDLFFIDSVTSGSSVARAAAQAYEVPFLARDIFLDAVHQGNDADFVRAQLGKTEDIARSRGYAIAIAHPHPTTLEMLGPWLVSAYARGFEIVTIDDLIAGVRQKRKSSNGQQRAAIATSGNEREIDPDKIGRRRIVTIGATASGARANEIEIDEVEIENIGAEAILTKAPSSLR